MLHEPIFNADHFWLNATCKTRRSRIALKSAVTRCWVKSCPVRHVAHHRILTKLCCVKFGSFNNTFSRGNSQASCWKRLLCSSKAFKAREIYRIGGSIFLFSDWLMCSRKLFRGTRSVTERHKRLKTNRIALQNVTLKTKEFLFVIKWESQVRQQVFCHDNIVTSPQRTQRREHFASSCIK